jgi:hypothetical protein
MYAKTIEIVVDGRTIEVEIEISPEYNGYDVEDCRVEVISVIKQ